MWLSNMLRTFFILNIVSQIINGKSYFEDAGQFESPWFVHMDISGERCGGSLINDQYVVTAAHCFDKRNSLGGGPYTDIKVYLGEWKLGTDPDCNGEYDYESCDYLVHSLVEKVLIHKEYGADEDETNKAYDIAILKLSNPLGETDIIGNIQLPSPDDCASDFAETNMTTFGFGKKDLYSFAKQKKKMNFSVRNKTECKRGDRKFNEEFHFCGSGSENVTTCKGDSGSGVMTVRNGKPVLQGIVSYGASKCEPTETPSVFVKVSCFIDWIHDQMGIPKPPRLIQTVTESAAIKTSTPESAKGDGSDYGDFV